MSIAISQDELKLIVTGVFSHKGGEREQENKGEEWVCYAVTGKSGLQII